MKTTLVVVLAILLGMNFYQARVIKQQRAEMRYLMDTQDMLMAFIESHNCFRK